MSLKLSSDRERTRRDREHVVVGTRQDLFVESFRRMKGRGEGRERKIENERTEERLCSKFTKTNSSLQLLCCRRDDAVSAFRIFCRCRRFSLNRGLVKNEVEYKSGEEESEGERGGEREREREREEEREREREEERVEVKWRRKLKEREKKMRLEKHYAKS